ncbi:cytochrome P450 2B1-like [Mizuhopecten yessoensis]|uniref:Vitamin D 25-hydroxylase n=1 Tax=Mizuhopecten yessoensis TaxID=6573 RepID=A0A210PES9_MIZYE|nr:cytochrome P450 2B1-like [Mizuhopecten yessoensis]OWF34961.1 Vitamin D 25-hydroxylase [Mizuhopecten yessoensis]
MSTYIGVSEIPSFIIPAFLLTVSLYWLWKREMARVPGPRGLPIIGNIPQVTGGGFDQKLQRFRDRYGNIFRLKLGEMTTIFVFGLKNIEEVLLGRNENFEMRPNWLYIPDKVIQKKGLIWTNGEMWQRLRDIMTNTQNSPDSGQHTEKQIMTEIHHTVKLLHTGSDLGETGIDPSSLFSASTFNILSSFVFGQRFEMTETDYSLLKDGIADLTERNKTQNPVNMFPSLGACMTRKRDEAIVKESELFIILKKYLTAHASKRCPGNPSRDLMDTYIQQTETNIESDTENTENNFLRSILDMYIYGSEMTSSLLLWTVVFLVRYPDVQRKCQDEMDLVVGDRDLTSSDRANGSLPYCVAVLKEILRISSPAVMTTLHTNHKSAIVGGHLIPERSLVVCDLHNPRFDENLWENPSEFKPERFLSKLSAEQERVASLSFGLGPRCCPARKLSETAHFLYCMNLIRHFRIHHYDESVPIPLTADYKGVSLKPRPFKVVFKPREVQVQVSQG